MRFDQPSTSAQSSVGPQSDSSSSTEGSSTCSVVSCDEVQIVPIVDESQVDRTISAGYYLHDKTLGQGLFGKVCLVTHVKTFQHAALKVINKKRFRNEEDKLAVYNEINSLKVLRHRNIARLLQIIETDDRIYIVREYCSNGDLYDHVERKGKLSEAESRSIFRDLIGCLDYIHQHGFLHCDVRPENILLDSRFRIKLIGFRLAHLGFGNVASHELASIKTTHLSPEYTAPEALLTGTMVCTPAIDVFASGCLLYFTLTGTLPFADDSLARLFKKIQSGFFELHRELPDDARDLIVSMLKVNPLERANVKQILSHQWLRCEQREMPSEVVSEDKLDDNALNECMVLHSQEVQDIVQLRYNIRHKFCYQSATYWLIKENYDKFKTLDLRPSSVQAKFSMNLLRQIADSKAKQFNGTAVRRRHTFMESRVAPNSSKVTLKSGKSRQDDRKCAITASLAGTQSSEESGCESKKRSKLVKPRKDASIADLAPRLPTKPDNEEQMWPVKAKSHFNLRRIFSKPQIADKRSNSAKSIETDSEQDASGQPMPSYKSSGSLLKKSISRRFSFAFSTKLLGKNLSRINSASSVDKNDAAVTGKRVWPSRQRDQSQSSLVDTTDSDEQRVNRSKSIRFSTIDSSDELEQADGQSDSGSGTGPISLCSNDDNVQLPIKDSVPTIDHADGPTRAANQSSKINRHKSMQFPSKSGSSVAIITRYSNYEECLAEAAGLLSAKGINCKADKRKLRCCVSAMNQILVAFQLELHTFPSLNCGAFVMIKVKKIRGNNDDFHVICESLTKHFERRHLKRHHQARK